MAADGSIVFDTKIDNSGFKAGLAQNKAELKSLQNEINKTTRARDSLQKQLEKAPSKDSLTASLKEAQSILEALQKKASELQSKISSNTSLQNNLETDKQTLSELEAEFSKLKEEADSYARTYGQENLPPANSPFSPENLENISNRISELKEKIASTESALSGVNTNADTSALEKVNGEIEKAQANVEQLKQQLATTTTKESLQPDLDAANQKLAELQKKAEELQKTISNKSAAAPIAAEYDKAIAEYNKAHEKIQKAIASGVDPTSNQFKNLLRDLDEAVKKAQQFGAEMQKAVPGSTGNVSNILSGMNGPNTGIMQSILGADAIKQQYSVLIDGLKSFASGAKDSISLVLKDMQGLGKGAISLANGALKKMGIALGNQNSGFKVGLKNILRYAFGIRSLFALFNRLRSAIKEGIQNLAQFNGGVNPVNASISSLTSSLNYLKNAWAAAFAPILNAVAPALSALIDMLASAANAIASFISLLTGKSTYIKAIKVQKDYAKSLGGTGNAAKKAAKALASFDEINQLNLQKNENSGGGGGGAGAGSGFTVAPVGKEFQKWLNTDDWTELGKDVANKLNKLLKSVDDWINDVLYPQGELWAKRLGTFTEGIIEGLDWVLLGKTISDGLEAILHIINTYLAQINFVLLGSNIADTVNAVFMNKGLWDEVSQFISNRFNILIDLLYGFIENAKNYAFEWGNTFGVSLARGISGIKWDELATAIIDGFAAMTEFIRGFVSNEKEWEKVKDGIVNAINRVIHEINLNDFMDAANSILEGLLDAANEIDWYMLGKKVGEAIAHIDWSRIAKTAIKVIGETFAGYINGLFSSGDGTLFAAIRYGIPLLKGAVLLGGAVLKMFTIGKIGTSLATIASSLTGGIAGVGAQAGAAATSAVAGAGATTASGISGLGPVLLGAIKGLGLAGLGVADILLWSHNILAIIDYTHEKAEVDAEKAQANANETAAVLKLQSALAAKGIKASTEDIESYLKGTNPSFQNVIDSAMKMKNGVGNAMDRTSQNASKFSDNISQQSWELKNNVTDAAKGAQGQLSQSANKATADVRSAMNQTSQNAGNFNDDISQQTDRFKQTVGDASSKTQSTIAQASANAEASVGASTGAINQHSLIAAQQVEINTDKMSSSVQSNTNQSSQAIGNFVSDAQSKGNDFGNGFIGNVKSSSAGLPGEVSSIAGSGFAPLKNLVGEAASWGRDIIDSMISGIKAAAGGIASAVSGIAGTIRSYIHFSEPDVGPLKDFHKWMPDFMGGLADDILKNGYKLEDAVKKVAEGMSLTLTPAVQLRAIGANIDRFAMPRLATGTIVPPSAGEFAAILGDNRTDTEVVSPLETIKEAMMEALQESGSAGKQQITIRFDGNLAQLARILKPYIENENKRSGITLVTDTH